MSIRREQALFLIVLALGAWFWTGLGGRTLPTRLVHKDAESPELDPLQVVLADPRPSAGPPARDLFREPSESSPLPPRPLPFPELGRMPVVLPPLEPGQEAGSYWQLRVVREPVEHAFAEVAGEAVIEAAAPRGPTSEPPDHLHFANGNKLPVRIHNEDKFALASRQIVDEEIRYDWLSADGSRVVKHDQVAAVGEVTRIELADTVANTVGMRVFQLRDAGQANVGERKELVRFLLEKAAEGHRGLFAVAEEQAQAIIRDVPGVDGYRWLVRVLRAQGAVAREAELYFVDTPDAIQGTALLHRGRGEIEATLTLWADAEANLRQAVELGRTNARSLAALARFLHDRGRTAEALPFAEAAARQRIKLTESDVVYEVGAAHVEVLLALGKLDEADAAVGGLSAQNGLAAELAYLRGAVSYARGEFARAAGQFETAASAGSPDAVLGRGLCHLVAGEWDAARNKLAWVVDHAPLLRHRAHAALALLYELTSHLDLAREHVDQALLAAPKDPYGLYLSGHLLRLEGRYTEAVETQIRALSQRDDLVESLAETMLAMLRQSEQPDADRVDLLTRAVRYADRSVKLDASRANELLFTELQGVAKHRLGDMAGAREAFHAAVERGSDLALIGLAQIDYAQKRTNDARDALVALSNDPSRPDATREFARSLVDLIDDHASKEQVRDGFERSELGGIWDRQNSGQVIPHIEDGKLVMRGTAKAQSAHVRRTLERGANYLGAGVTMKIAERTSVQFAGLEIASAGRGGSQFSLKLGIRAGTASLQAAATLQDGNPREGDEPDQLLDVSGFDPYAEHRIEVEARPGERPNSFRLVILWNGEAVHTWDDVRTLRPTTSTELNVDLVAQARGNVDVTFDDFRLERRRNE